MLCRALPSFTAGALRHVHGHGSVRYKTDACIRCTLYYTRVSPRDCYAMPWFVVPQVHDGTFTPTSQFIKDPDSLCSTVTWKDEEDRVIWVYRIQVGGRGEGWVGGKGG